jgi:hypothetical protein
MAFALENFPKDWIDDLVDQKFYGIDEDYCFEYSEDFDYFSSINEFDCYGQVQWSNDRPIGFDGSAEIIDRDRNGKLWWLPYRDGKKVYNSSKSRQVVMDICNYGFRVITLKLIGPAWDANKTKHRITLSQSSIGGLEPFVSHSDCIEELACDVLQEFS